MNAEFDREEAASRKRMEIVALRERRKELLRLNGSRWFADLIKQIHEDALRFNEQVKDTTKRLKIEERPGEIRILFLDAHFAVAVTPVCIVKPNFQNMSLDIEFLSGKKEFGGREATFAPKEEAVFVSVKFSVKKLITADEDGRKLTGDYFVDVREQYVTETKELDVSALSEYLLEDFLQHPWPR